MKKYELTNETLEWKGCTLHRIRALKDFADVEKGDLGGWIESELNLSQEGDCWVYDDAKVYDDACILDNAKIRDNVEIFEYAKIYGNAIVSNTVGIWGHAEISGYAEISEYAGIYGDAKISGYAKISGDVEIYENARISGNAIVNGSVYIIGDAVIEHTSDYTVFKNNWSSGRYFIWTKSNNMWSVGCFYGTGEELIKKAYKDSKLSGDMYKMYVDLVNNHFLNK